MIKLAFEIALICVLVPLILYALYSLALLLQIGIGKITEKIKSIYGNLRKEGI